MPPPINTPLPPRPPFGPLGWTSLVLFTLSLAFPGFYTDWDHNSPGWSPAIGLLLCGCCALADGITAWLANPLLLTTWILFKSRTPRPRLALLTAAASLLFALGFLLATKITVTEAGHTGNITSYGLGYYLWLASILTTLLHALQRLKSNSSKFISHM